MQRRDGKLDTPFSEWVRKNDSLDSKANFLSCTDIDYIWHRFGEPAYGGMLRTQHIMFIEEKTREAETPKSQADTFHFLNQLFCRAEEKLDNEYWSQMRQDKVTVHWWGCHELRYGLNLSDNLTWDGTPITPQTLEEILRFERNPRTLKKRNIQAEIVSRSRSNKHSDPDLKPF